ncbi:MAG: hypothetical protein K6B13_11175 [Prevotella sp.]|nr:hypothetical protein [Prevotella sp.]
MEATKNKRMPRGIRNNNPLNLRRTKTRWAGLSQEQTDPAFFQFSSMTFGWRAAWMTLRSYYNKYGLRTVRDILNRWAPPSDSNNTDRYIGIVSEKSGWKADKVLPSPDEAPATWMHIMAAMATVENGECYGSQLSEDEIVVAWHLMELSVVK